MAAASPSQVRTPQPHPPCRPRQFWHPTPVLESAIQCPHLQVAAARNCPMGTEHLTDAGTSVNSLKPCAHCMWQCWRCIGAAGETMAGVT